jgi:hypothetical protein
MTASHVGDQTKTYNNWNDYTTSANTTQGRRFVLADYGSLNKSKWLASGTPGFDKKYCELR